MKCFIPSAGFGKRMGVLTKDTPKPMLPVFGVPLIYYALFFAKKLGATEIIMNLHYKAEKILRELDHFCGSKISYSIEAPEILGTAGGIKTAIAERLEEDEAFIVVNPDSIFLPKNELIIPDHYSGEALLYLLPSPKGEDYTSLDLQNGKVAFHGGSYYYIGFSVLKKSIFQEVTKNQYSDLAVVFKELSEKKKLDGMIFDGDVLDFGDFDKYEKKKDLPVFQEEEFLQFRKFLEMRTD